MALELISGNMLQFGSVTASGTDTLEFNKPVKKFMSNVEMVLTSDDGDELINITPDVVYEFPNNFGYPGYINVKNPDTQNAITPVIFVVEFGDATKDEYFKVIEIE